jgi:hypothetical protein
MGRGPSLKFIVLLVGLLLPVLAWAQGSSGIAGIVRDASGAVLPGVTVEAASPVLIEKTRTVVTDGEGRYSIIDLRPGTYTVTFSLTGFSTVKREGLELTTSFTATVNADLRVGELSETITVSGQSPVVDVQNVVQQRVMTREVLEGLPNAKSIQSLTALIPGLSSGGTTSQDVGGTVGDLPTAVAIHGGRTADQHIFYDGMRTNNINAVGGGGGNSMSIFFNPAAVAQISMEIGNLAVQSETGGVVINVVPKDGGNLFTASFLANGTNGSMQSDNLTDDLRARGLTAVTTIKNIFDLNAAVGGPVLKDKLWFYSAYRRWGNENYVAGRYFAMDPLAWISVPDLSRQAYEQNMHRSINGRVTWQADRKNKVSFAVDRQDQCVCYSGIINSFGGVGSVSPEATTFTNNSPSAYMQIKWTNTLSNRLLLEAGGSRNMMNWNSAPQPGVGPDVISVTELRTNLTYRAPTSYTGRLHDQAIHAESYFGSFAASYVTGSHAAKMGVMLLHGRPYWDTQVNGDRTYQFLDGVPRAVILRTTPLLLRNRLKADVGLYAQDQWTVKRLTLNLGLRYTYLNAYVPEQHVPAGTFVAARDFAEVPGVALWHDLTPRLGGAYDLFGNGKTAVKFSVGKYLVSEAAGAADIKNPQNTVVNSASRAWTDANGNYVPDCELLSPDANGECGPLSNRNFGNLSRVSTTIDDDILHGYGRRRYNWEISAGLQHEVWRGVSANATYFRRWYGNFRIIDDRAVDPSDYDPYCITAPVDPRLPGGGGNQICGLYDINPRKFGLVDQYVTFAKNYGKLTDVYDGVDLTLSARLPRGAIMQGGLNVGREMTDMCDVVGKVDAPAVALPYSNAAHEAAIPIASLSGLASPSTLFCHVAPPFLSELKISGAYPLPWWGVQLSATVQSIPGPPVVATAVVSSAQVAPSLGRDLAAGAAGTATVQLVAPGTMFGDRLNQVDFRVTKTFRANRANIRGMMDLYNLFNASPVLALNNRYGPAWQQPFVILAGRFVKFGVQVDF